LNANRKAVFRLANKEDRKEFKRMHPLLDVYFFPSSLRIDPFQPPFFNIA